MSETHLPAELSAIGDRLELAVAAAIARRNIEPVNGDGAHMHDPNTNSDTATATAAGTGTGTGIASNPRTHIDDGIRTQDGTRTGTDASTRVERPTDARRRTGADAVLDPTSRGAVAPAPALVSSTAAAAVSDVDRARRRRRRLITGGVVGGLLVVGAGTAAAVSLLSTDTVARGLPGGSVIFTGTEPSCTTSDHIVFDCTLTSAPTVDALSDYTGTLEPFVDDSKHIAGGCRGLDAAGLHWTCFAGQRAVDEGIIGQDFLGEFSPGTGRG